MSRVSEWRKRALKSQCLKAAKESYKIFHPGLRKVIQQKPPGGASLEVYTLIKQICFFLLESVGKSPKRNAFFRNGYCVHGVYRVILV